MTAPEESLDLARVAGQAAADKLAEEVIGLDVSELVVITDVFLVCSGDSERQVSAIVDGVEEALLTERRRKPLRREGERGPPIAPGSSSCVTARPSTTGRAACRDRSTSP